MSGNRVPRHELAPRTGELELEEVVEQGVGVRKRSCREEKPEAGPREPRPLHHPMRGTHRVIDVDDPAVARDRGERNRSLGRGRARTRQSGCVSRDIQISPAREVPLRSSRPSSRTRTAGVRQLDVHRVFGSGVRSGSTSARRCSKFGGRMSVSPRCAGSSSAAKPGPERRDLEQHAGRLAEVDRAEPEAVDHRRRVPARAVTRSRHASCSSIAHAHATWWTVPEPPIARRVGRRLVLDPAAPRVPARQPALEAERLEERRRLVPVRANALEALQRQLTRDLGMVGDQRHVRRRRDHEVVSQPVRVRERNEPTRSRQNSTRLLRADPPDDGVDHPGARPALRARPGTRRT